LNRPRMEALQEQGMERVWNERVPGYKNCRP
jgi:hypothetical protein